MVSLESQYISRQVKIISGMLFIVFKNKNKKSLQFLKKRRDRALLFIDYKCHETLMLNIIVRQLGYPFRFHNGVMVGHLMLGKTDRFAKIIF